MKKKFIKKKNLKIVRKLRPHPKIEKSSMYKNKLNSHYRFFIYKIFKSTIKNGKKIKSYNNFSKNIFLYLKKKK